MNIEYDIKLSSPHLSGKEQHHLNLAFERNELSWSGENLDLFEKKLGSKLNGAEVAALSSGTAAIHLALILLGVQAGDEVIASTFTYAASINPIRYQNAIPVLVDSERETWNMNPEILEECIKDRIQNGKKPKAIILVHLYGMPSKMVELMAIADHFGIPVIEDAAEALGSKYHNQAMGTFGEMGVLSFNGNKIITTSGGGALISNKRNYCDKAKFLSTQALDSAPHYQHSKIGFNYRMTNVAASIGLGQIDFLQDRINSRRRNYDQYKKELSDCGHITFLEEPAEYYSNRWLTTILTDSFESREKIRLSLQQNKIESRPLWKPMHLQPVFESCPVYVDGTSEDLFDKGLCLPSGSDLSQKDILSITDLIINCSS